MVCSLSLYIQFHKKIKAQHTKIFSVSCAFFSFINHLFINDFCCSVANNYRLYFQNLFSYQASLYLVTSLYWIQNKMTNVRIADTEKGSDLLQLKPHLPLQCLSFIKFYHTALSNLSIYRWGFITCTIICTINKKVCICSVNMVYLVYINI